LIALVGAFWLAAYTSGARVGLDELLGRTLLLAAIGLLLGYLVHLQRICDEKVRAGAAYTSDLFEFGRTLARVDEPETLYVKIPRLISAIMSADNCELALIEEDRIVKRFMPNRHCRDYCNVPLSRSVHGRVATSSEVFAFSDLQEDPEFRRKEDFLLYSYRSCLARAWFNRSRPAGVLAVFQEKKTSWSEFQRRQFQFLVDQAVLALQNTSLRQELEALARTDGLTGLANHRYFYERLEEEFARAQRKRHPFTVVLIDLDYFKRLNDTHGHRVGDQVLEQLGLMLKSTVRRMDLAGRLGGDEFAVALPETSPTEADAFCQRLLEGAGKLKVGELTGFSLSIGSATYPAEGQTLSEVVEHADQALYRSKELGRGRFSRYAAPS
jgi:diguanylate cyclase (GGDEF)-like protein